MDLVLPGRATAWLCVFAQEARLVRVSPGEPGSIPAAEPDLARWLGDTCRGISCAVSEQSERRIYLRDQRLRRWTRWNSSFPGGQPLGCVFLRKWPVWCGFPWEGRVPSRPRNLTWRDGWVIPTEASVARFMSRPSAEFISEISGWAAGRDGTRPSRVGNRFAA